MDVITSHATLPPGALPHAAVWPKPDEGRKGRGTTPPSDADHGEPLHRLSEIRRREGVSRHLVALRLGVSEAEVARQERPDCDLTLSQLHGWQAALRVPMSELLSDQDDGLSRPVRFRAQLLRAMKTVRSIEERSQRKSLRRLAAMLVEQITEIMPELRDVDAWPTVGQQRLPKDPGQAYLRGIGHLGLDRFDHLDP